MNHRSLATGLALAALAAAALAQPAAHHGKWTGSYLGPSGVEVGVEMVLGESGGTWRMSPPAGRPVGRNNPCLGKEFPVAIASPSPSEISVEINGAQVVAGCLQQKATVKLLDDRTLELTFGNGRTSKFVRS